MMIIVTSKRWSGTQPGKDDIVIDISRTNPLLGNPYPMRDKSLAERERVIAANNRRIDRDIAIQGPIYNEFNRIAELAIKTGQNIALSCWCAPCTCHGDRYKEEIERMISMKKDLPSTESSPSNTEGLLHTKNTFRRLE